MNHRTTLPLEVAGVPMSWDEFSAAQKRVTRQPFWVWIVFFVGAIVAAAGLLWLSWGLGGFSRGYSTFVWIAAMTAVAIINRRLYRRRQQEALWKAHAAYLTMRGEGVERIRLFGDHLEALGERRRMAMPYHTLREAVEDKNGFLLLWGGMILSIPARSLTAAQATDLHAFWAAVLPPKRLTVKALTVGQRETPLSVPAIPERPVTPPEATCEVPRETAERWARAQFSTVHSPFMLAVGTTAGLYTALAIDPQDVFLWADVLCVIAWSLLFNGAVRLWFHFAKNPCPTRLLGMSPTDGGIIVFAESGETFVPRSLFSAKESGDTLYLQTPLGPLVLPYSRMTDPARVRRELELY